MKSSKNNFLKASAIVQRLPFHQQLSNSQSLLNKLSPIWLKWTQKNLTIEISSCLSPNHFDNGKLNIDCTNAIAATQIQQRQQTLLDYFHQNGLTEIQRFAISITNSSFNQKKPNPTDHSYKQSTRLNDSALDSIKNCQETVNHQPLSESLNRLLNTVKLIEPQKSTNKESDK